MRIRDYRPEDAPALAELFHAAVHEIAGIHYSAEQIGAWVPAIPDPEFYRARAADGRVILVATDCNDAPVAYGDLEANGHIDHLYCRPDFAGTGVTSSLYGRLEEAARQRGIRLLTVEASEPARSFFLKHGFTVAERREFPIRDVLIHNYRMEKRLEPLHPAGEV
jgi:putative acetyltransferase